MKKYNNTNLGNGQTTTNEDDAKRALLSRDYPEIANYETPQVSYQSTSLFRRRVVVSKSCVCHCHCCHRCLPFSPFL